MLVHFFFDLLLWTFLLGTSHNGSIFFYLNSWNSCIQCKNIPVNGSGAIQSRTQEIIHKAMASSGMPRSSPLHNPSMAPTKAKVYPALSRSFMEQFRAVHCHHERISSSLLPSGITTPVNDPDSFGLIFLCSTHSSSTAADSSSSP